MAQPRAAVSSDQRVAFKRFKTALEPFKALREPTVPMQYITAFMEVALEEDQNVSEYAKRTGTSQSLMTRYLADMGAVNRYHEEGLGLVEAYDDLMDRRNRLVRLTPKGKSLAWRVFEALKG